MGTRGPIREPESRRGQQEGLAVIPVSDTRAPEAPAYLNAREKTVFRELVDDALKASLAPLMIDGPLFAKIARMEVMLEKERDPDKFLKVMRMLLNSYQSAGMTEVARRRLGIRPE